MDREEIINRKKTLINILLKHGFKRNHMDEGKETYDGEYLDVIINDVNLGGVGTIGFFTNKNGVEFIKFYDAFVYATQADVKLEDIHTLILVDEYDFD